MIRPKLGRRRWIPIALVVLLIASALVLKLRPQTAESDEAQASESLAENEDQGERRVPVELAVARATDLPLHFNATGTLEALRRVELISKGQGQLTRLLVEEGDRVREGQVLLEIDHREQSYVVEEARVRVETARLELARMEDMQARGLETDRALESARQSFEVNQAQYELAKVRLEDLIVRAPFAGQISARKVELGQSVQVGAALLELTDVSAAQLKLYLPETVVKDLAVGQPVDIRPDVAPQELLHGSVLRIAPVVDAATSTVKVTLEVQDIGRGARIGSFVRAKITTDVHHGAVAVPRKAIVAEAGATYLFVAESDSVRKVEVSTGYSDDRWIEVSQGLSVGDTVVVVGQGGLRTGSRIEDLNTTVDAEQSSDEKTDEDDSQLVTLN